MKARMLAFGVHLGISALIALLVVGLVFYVWYPAPLHDAVGVTQIFLVVLAVDVVLGPCLTFAVFKQGKKTLKFDLAVIALLQFSALGYGLYTVAEGRPAWLVFNSDRFDLVRAVDLDPRYPEWVADDYRSPAWLGPRWVAAFAPENTRDSARLLEEVMVSGLDVPQRPYLYSALENAHDIIRQKALPLSKLDNFNTAGEVKAALQAWPQANAWLPMMSSPRPMVVLLERSTTDIRILAVVDLRPWA